MKPLAIDLFCGLGGWTEGLLAEGYHVIGFDIEQHVYGEARYPAQLVIQDVLTLHGKQFKDAALIVASPPCQEYSYMAMPWSLAKAKAAAIRADSTGVMLANLTRLFDACFRIQQEAIEAAGHHIPLVVENVKGAIPWVGRSRWNFGSFHLWGDVPALMPMTKGRGVSEAVKRTGTTWCSPEHSSIPDVVKGRTGAKGWCDESATAIKGIKNTGGSWFNIGSPGQKEVGRNPVHELTGRKGIPHRTAGHWRNPEEHEGIKQHGSGREWFAGDGKISRMTSSGSKARKAASAQIAKIPFELSRHIARTYYP